MNRTTATLIGLLYTDGCLSPKGKSSWRFYFSNKSERLVAIFRESMMQCFALPASRVRLGTTNDGLYRALVDSKEAGARLTERILQTPAGSGRQSSERSGGWQGKNRNRERYTDISREDRIYRWRAHNAHFEILAFD